MDDYSVNSLIESQNEWCARLVYILTPLIIDGYRSIFEEAWKLCKENDELDKYLMTFQNFIGRVPKWNSEMIKGETARIIEKSGCGYLEELISCVHIIKLKALTCARVGQKQKKVDITIPPLDEFIHRVYINVARKIYTNVYLFDKNVAPLQIQKHNRELEIIIKESILLTIRDSIPVETILRAYLDETQETDVEIDEQVEMIEEKVEPEPIETLPEEQMPPIMDELKEINELSKQAQASNVNGVEIMPPTTLPPLPPSMSSHVVTIPSGLSDAQSETKIIGNETIKFNDVDFAIDTTGKNEMINAPKTIERLEHISLMNNERRKQDEDDDDKLVIGNDISLEPLDVLDYTNIHKASSEADPILEIEDL
jgi:hypothetical protein